MSGAGPARDNVPPSGTDRRRLPHAGTNVSGLLTPHLRTFRAFAITIVPELSSTSDRGWAEIEATVEHALGQRPQRMRRQVALLLRVLEHLPRVRYGRGFSRLTAARRTAVIETLQYVPAKLVRRGIWGLRTLVLMGAYTRRGMMDDVGYRADPRGWYARQEQIAQTASNRSPDHE